MKVLFYTHTPRAFRTSLVGYLYEIAKVHSTVLLSEKLDSETEQALKNRTLFPKLEEVIPVWQFTGPKMNLFAKNKYLSGLARNAIEQHRPDVVILTSDMYPLFELYLARFAKKSGALVISFQTCPTPPNITLVMKWGDLINAYLRFPSFLPLWLRLFLAKCRKYLGHFLYYWIFPIVVGEKPFFGKSSAIIRKGILGMREADYQIVFSKRDYYIYRDVYLRYGTPIEKLFILPHPLNREAREFFERIYWYKFKKYKENTKVMSLMLAQGFGFRRNDYSLVSPGTREKNWIETISLITKIFPRWKIFIKPHPDTKNIKKIKEKLESISENVKVVNPQEPADKYIEIANVIVGLPLTASTTLFTASLQCPGKPILSLDFHQELLDNLYQNFPGIVYIDNKDEFLSVLKSIRDNKYRERNDFNRKNEIKLKAIEFSNTIEMLEYLFRKKVRNKK